MCQAQGNLWSSRQAAGENEIREQTPAVELSWPFADYVSLTLCLRQTISATAELYYTDDASEEKHPRLSHVLVW